MRCGSRAGPRWYDPCLAGTGKFSLTGSSKATAARKKERAHWRRASIGDARHRDMLCAQIGDHAALAREMSGTDRDEHAARRLHPVDDPIRPARVAIGQQRFPELRL